MIEKISDLLRGYNIIFYPNSLRKINENLIIFVAKTKGEKKIGVLKKENLFYLEEPYFNEDLKATDLSYYLNIYPLNFENYKKLKELTPISPSTCDKNRSFGTGDRLGLVTSAQLSALKDYDLFPVLAQQSPRELIKTKRDFKDVLLKVVLGVLEANYKGKFGADADHIKNEEDLLEGISAGFTMYTLDIS
ncbi:MAG TPA: tagaturonate epimerase family protein, partial [Dictyoglomaceae bacterium]|nr:tagaturonate epimerase family protein [Dictyoglomaceae bacterium]